MEGTASYGRGLTAALDRAGEWVIEFDRPRASATKDGAKSDELDAVRAGREVLGRDRLHAPRAHDGHREALRVHTVTRAGVVRARTAAINELKALVLTAPDELRQQLRGLTTTALTKRCAAFRDAPQRPIAERCTRNTMRSIARRIITFNDEVKLHDRAIRELIARAAPSSSPNPASVTSPQRCSSSPGRIRADAATKQPLLASPVSHHSRRHQAKPRTATASTAAVTDNSTQRSTSSRFARARHHQPTLDYVERRRSEGRTDREIRRCLKRYIARRVWRLLEHPPSTEITP